MNNRHHAGQEALRRAVLETPGALEPEVRIGAEARAGSLSGRPHPTTPLEEPLGTWTDKIALHAYKTLDREVEALKRHGLDEDGVFELTLAAALGAASARYERAMEALAALDDEEPA